jgi:hypothetical protein
MFAANPVVPKQSPRFKNLPFDSIQIATLKIRATSKQEDRNIKKHPRGSISCLKGNGTVAGAFFIWNER